MSPQYCPQTQYNKQIAWPVSPVSSLPASLPILRYNTASHAVIAWPFTSSRSGSSRARSGLTESRGIPKAARVRFNLLAFDWRPAGMARAYSLDLRERVVGAVAAGQTCRSVAKTFMVSVASVVKWSQRQRAVGSPAALKMGGHRPYLVGRERGWVLARIAEKPDLTPRALLKELADRGLVVSYYALWHFLHHEGVTLKKKPSRLRTGPAGRRQAGGAVEGASGDDRSEAACVHRRDLGENQHDPLPWPMRQRRAPRRQSAFRQMADAHFPGGVAVRPAHRALRHRRTDQWRKLPR